MSQPAVQLASRNDHADAAEDAIAEAPEIDIDAEMQAVDAEVAYLAEVLEKLPRKQGVGVDVQMRGLVQEYIGPTIQRTWAVQSAALDDLAGQVDELREELALHALSGASAAALVGLMALAEQLAAGVTAGAPSDQAKPVAEALLANLVAYRTSFGSTLSRMGAAPPAEAVGDGTTAPAQEPSPASLAAAVPAIDAAPVAAAPVAAAPAPMPAAVPLPTLPSLKSA